MVQWTEPAVHAWRVKEVAIPAYGKLMLEEGEGMVHVSSFMALTALRYRNLTGYLPTIIELRNGFPPDFRQDPLGLFKWGGPWECDLLTFLNKL